MTTCHGGAGHTHEDRDLDSHVDDARAIDIGPNNDNASTNSLDTIIVFGGTEVDGHLSVLLPNNQADFDILAMEINNLQQQVQAGEG